MIRQREKELVEEEQRNQQQTPTSARGRKRVLIGSTEKPRPPRDQRGRNATRMSARRLLQMRSLSPTPSKAHYMRDDFDAEDSRRHPTSQYEPIIQPRQSFLRRRLLSHRHDKGGDGGGGIDDEYGDEDDEIDDDDDSTQHQHSHNHKFDSSQHQHHERRYINKDMRQQQQQQDILDCFRHISSLQHQQHGSMHILRVLSQLRPILHRLGVSQFKVWHRHNVLEHEDNDSHFRESAKVLENMEDEQDSIPWPELAIHVEKHRSWIDRHSVSIDNLDRSIQQLTQLLRFESIHFQRHASLLIISEGVDGNVIISASLKTPSEQAMASVTAAMLHALATSLSQSLTNLQHQRQENALEEELRATQLARASEQALREFAHQLQQMLTTVASSHFFSRPSLLRAIATAASFEREPNSSTAAAVVTLETVEPHVSQSTAAFCSVTVVGTTTKDERREYLDRQSTVARFLQDLSSSCSSFMGANAQGGTGTVLVDLSSTPVEAVLWLSRTLGQTLSQDSQNKHFLLTARRLFVDEGIFYEENRESKERLLLCLQPKSHWQFIDETQLQSIYSLHWTAIHQSLSSFSEQRKQQHQSQQQALKRDLLSALYSGFTLPQYSTSGFAADSSSNLLLHDRISQTAVGVPAEDILRSLANSLASTQLCRCVLGVRRAVLLFADRFLHQDMSSIATGASAFPQLVNFAVPGSVLTSIATVDFDVTKNGMRPLLQKPLSLPLSSWLQDLYAGRAVMINQLQTQRLQSQAPSLEGVSQQLSSFLSSAIDATARSALLYPVRATQSGLSVLVFLDPISSHAGYAVDREDVAQQQLDGTMLPPFSAQFVERFGLEELSQQLAALLDHTLLLQQTQSAHRKAIEAHTLQEEATEALQEAHWRQQSSASLQFCVQQWKQHTAWQRLSEQFDIQQRKTRWMSRLLSLRSGCVSDQDLVNRLWRWFADETCLLFFPHDQIVYDNGAFPESGSEQNHTQFDCISVKTDEGQLISLRRVRRIDSKLSSFSANERATFTELSSLASGVYLTAKRSLQALNTAVVEAYDLSAGLLNEFSAFLRTTSSTETHPLSTATFDDRLQAFSRRLRGILGVVISDSGLGLGTSLLNVAARVAFASDASEDDVASAFEDDRLDNGASHRVQWEIARNHQQVSSFSGSKDFQQSRVVIYLPMNDNSSNHGNRIEVIIDFLQQGSRLHDHEDAEDYEDTVVNVLRATSGTLVNAFCEALASISINQLRISRQSKQKQTLEQEYHLLKSGASMVREENLQRHAQALQASTMSTFLADLMATSTMFQQSQSVEDLGSLVWQSLPSVFQCTSTLLAVADDTSSNKDLKVLWPRVTNVRSQQPHFPRTISPAQLAAMPSFFDTSPSAIDATRNEYNDQQQSVLLLYKPHSREIFAAILLFSAPTAMTRSSETATALSLPLALGRENAESAMALVQSFLSTLFISISRRHSEAQRARQLQQQAQDHQDAVFSLQNRLQNEESETLLLKERLQRTQQDHEQMVLEYNRRSAETTAAISAQLQAHQQALSEEQETIQRLKDCALSLCYDRRCFEHGNHTHASSSQRHSPKKLRGRESMVLWLSEVAAERRLRLTVLSTAAVVARDVSSLPPLCESMPSIWTKVQEALRTGQTVLLEAKERPLPTAHSNSGEGAEEITEVLFRPQILLVPNRRAASALLLASNGNAMRNKLAKKPPHRHTDDEDNDSVDSLSIVDRPMDENSESEDEETPEIVTGDSIAAFIFIKADGFAAFNSSDLSLIEVACNVTSLVLSLPITSARKPKPAVQNPEPPEPVVLLRDYQALQQAFVQSNTETANVQRLVQSLPRRLLLDVTGAQLRFETHAQIAQYLENLGEKLLQQYTASARQQQQQEIQVTVLFSTSAFRRERKHFGQQVLLKSLLGSVGTLDLLMTPPHRSAYQRSRQQLIAPIVVVNKQPGVTSGTLSLQGLLFVEKRPRLSSKKTHSDHHDDDIDDYQGFSSPGSMKGDATDNNSVHSNNSGVSSVVTSDSGDIQINSKDELIAELLAMAGAWLCLQLQSTQEAVQCIQEAGQAIQVVQDARQELQTRYVAEVALRSQHGDTLSAIHRIHLQGIATADEQRSSNSPAATPSSSVVASRAQKTAGSTESDVKLLHLLESLRREALLVAAGDDAGIVLHLGDEQIMSRDVFSELFPLIISGSPTDEPDNGSVERVLYLSEGGRSSWATIDQGSAEVVSFNDEKILFAASEAHHPEDFISWVAQQHWRQQFQRLQQELSVADARDVPTLGPVHALLLPFHLEVPTSSSASVRIRGSLVLTRRIAAFGTHDAQCLQHVVAATQVVSTRCTALASMNLAQRQLTHLTKESKALKSIRKQHMALLQKMESMSFQWAHNFVLRQMVERSSARLTSLLQRSDEIDGDRRRSNSTNSSDQSAEHVQTVETMSTPAEVRSGFFVAALQYIFGAREKAQKASENVSSQEKDNYCVVTSQDVASYEEELLRERQARRRQLLSQSDDDRDSRDSDEDIEDYETVESDKRSLPDESVDSKEPSRKASEANNIRRRKTVAVYFDERGHERNNVHSVEDDYDRYLVAKPRKSSPLVEGDYLELQEIIIIVLNKKSETISSGSNWTLVQALAMGFQVIRIHLHPTTAVSPSSSKGLTWVVAKPLLHLSLSLTQTCDAWHGVTLRLSEKLVDERFRSTQEKLHFAQALTTKTQEVHEIERSFRQLLQAEQDKAMQLSTRQQEKKRISAALSTALCRATCLAFVPSQFVPVDTVLQHFMESLESYLSADHPALSMVLCNNTAHNPVAAYIAQECSSRSTEMAASKVAVCASEEMLGVVTALTKEVSQSKNDAQVNGDHYSNYHVYMLSSALYAASESLLDHHQRIVSEDPSESLTQLLRQGGAVFALLLYRGAIKTDQTSLRVPSKVLLVNIAAKSPLLHSTATMRHLLQALLLLAQHLDTRQMHNHVLSTAHAYQKSLAIQRLQLNWTNRHLATFQKRCWLLHLHANSLGAQLVEQQATVQQLTHRLGNRNARLQRSEHLLADWTQLTKSAAAASEEVATTYHRNKKNLPRYNAEDKPSSHEPTSSVQSLWARCCRSLTALLSSTCAVQSCSLILHADHQQAQFSQGLEAPSRRIGAPRSQTANNIELLAVGASSPMKPRRRANSLSNNNVNPSKYKVHSIHPVEEEDPEGSREDALGNIVIEQRSLGKVGDADIQRIVTDIFAHNQNPQQDDISRIPRCVRVQTHPQTPTVTLLATVRDMHEVLAVLRVTLHLDPALSYDANSTDEPQRDPQTASEETLSAAETTTINFATVFVPLLRGALVAQQLQAELVTTHAQHQQAEEVAQTLQEALQTLQDTHGRSLRCTSRLCTGLSTLLLTLQPSGSTDSDQDQAGFEVVEDDAGEEEGSWSLRRLRFLAQRLLLAVSHALDCKLTLELSPLLMSRSWLQQRLDSSFNSILAAGTETLHLRYDPHHSNDAQFQLGKANDDNENENDISAIDAYLVSIPLRQQPERSSGSIPQDLHDEEIVGELVVHCSAIRTRDLIRALSPALATLVPATLSTLLQSMQSKRCVVAAIQSLQELERLHVSVKAQQQQEVQTWMLRQQAQAEDAQWSFLLRRALAAILTVQQQAFTRQQLLHNQKRQQQDKAMTSGPNEEDVEEYVLIRPAVELLQRLYQLYSPTLLGQGLKSFEEDPARPLLAIHCAATFAETPMLSPANDSNSNQGSNLGDTSGQLRTLLSLPSSSSTAVLSPSTWSTTTHLRTLCLLRRSAVTLRVKDPLVTAHQVSQGLQMARSTATKITTGNQDVVEGDVDVVIVTIPLVQRHTFTDTFDETTSNANAPSVHVSYAAIFDETHTISADEVIVGVLQIAYRASTDESIHEMQGGLPSAVHQLLQKVHSLSQGLLSGCLTLAYELSCRQQTHALSTRQILTEQQQLQQQRDQLRAEEEQLREQLHRQQQAKDAERDAEYQLLLGQQQEQLVHLQQLKQSHTILQRHYVQAQVDYQTLQLWTQHLAQQLPLVAKRLCSTKDSNRDDKLTNNSNPSLSFGDWSQLLRVPSITSSSATSRSNIEQLQACWALHVLAQMEVHTQSTSEQCLRATVPLSLDTTSSGTLPDRQPVAVIMYQLPTHVQVDKEPKEDQRRHAEQTITTVTNIVFGTMMLLQRMHRLRRQSLVRTDGVQRTLVDQQEDLRQCQSQVETYAETLKQHEMDMQRLVQRLQRREEENALTVRTWQRRVEQQQEVSRQRYQLLRETWLQRMLPVLPSLLSAVSLTPFHQQLREYNNTGGYLRSGHHETTAGYKSLLFGLLRSAQEVESLSQELSEAIVTCGLLDDAESDDVADDEDDQENVVACDNEGEEEKQDRRSSRRSRSRGSGQEVEEQKDRLHSRSRSRGHRGRPSPSTTVTTVTFHVSLCRVATSELGDTVDGSMGPEKMAPSKSHEKAGKGVKDGDKASARAKESLGVGVDILSLHTNSNVLSRPRSNYASTSSQFVVPPVTDYQVQTQTVFLLPAALLQKGSQPKGAQQKSYTTEEASTLETVLLSSTSSTGSLVHYHHLQHEAVTASIDEVDAQGSSLPHPSDLLGLPPHLLNPLLDQIQAQQRQPPPKQTIASKKDAKKNAKATNLTSAMVSTVDNSASTEYDLWFLPLSVDEMDLSAPSTLESSLATTKLPTKAVLRILRITHTVPALSSVTVASEADEDLLRGQRLRLQQQRQQSLLYLEPLLVTSFAAAWRSYVQQTHHEITSYQSQRHQQHQQLSLQTALAESEEQLRQWRLVVDRGAKEAVVRLLDAVPAVSTRYGYLLSITVGDIEYLTLMRWNLSFSNLLRFSCIGSSVFVV